MVKQVFIHIPKTAGTKVRALLERQYGKVGAAYPSPPYRPLAGMTPGERKAFLACDVVIGHEDYHSFHALLGDDVTYSTLLRNPVDRVISYYNHAQSHFERYREQKVSLLKFLSWPANFQARDYQVRYLCGKPQTAPVTEQDLKTVIRLVDEGKIRTGIQELFAESLESLPIFAGIDPGTARSGPRVNASIFGFSRASFTKEEIEAIKTVNRLDFRLYSHCLDRLRAGKA